MKRRRYWSTFKQQKLLKVLHVSFEKNAFNIRICTGIHAKQFFLILLVCSYEYWQVQVYFTLLFIPQHNPLCREPAICISRWNLLRTSGWRRRLASFSGYHKDSPGTPRPRPKFWASDVDPCGQALYPQPNSNLQG